MFSIPSWGKFPMKNDWHFHFQWLLTLEWCQYAIVCLICPTGISSYFSCALRPTILIIFGRQIPKLDIFFARLYKRFSRIGSSRNGSLGLSEVAVNLYTPILKEPLREKPILESMLRCSHTSTHEIDWKSEVGEMPTMRDEIVVLLHLLAYTKAMRPTYFSN